MTKVDLKLLVTYKGKTYECGADVHSYKGITEMAEYMGKNIEDKIRLEEEVFVHEIKD